MTEQTLNVGSPGEGGDANPAPSGESVDGNAGQLSDLVKEAISEALKPIKGEISGLYSRQDRDRNQFREFMDEFKKFKANGLSDSEAEAAAQNALGEKEQTERRNQVLDKLAERFLNTPSPQSPGKGVSGAVDAAKVISEHGLNMSDPLVAILANGKYDSEDAVKIAIADYIRATKAAPSPTPAQAPAAAGGTTTPQNLTADQVEAKSAELNKLYLNPTVNKDAIAKLEKELTPYWSGS